MLLGQVPKQPRESFKVGADFTRRFQAGESLAAITATSRNLNDGSDTTAAFLTQASVSGALAQVRLRSVGNAPGETHRVQLRVVTSLGNTYEVEIDVVVSET